MATFKTCDNGHNFDEEKYLTCPYCPNKASNIDYKKTLTDFKNTQAHNRSEQFSKTKVTDTSARGDDFFKSTQNLSENFPSLQPSEKRKLVGWLVSFNNDQYGQDFRLYSGKNKIGSSAPCDIILNDPSVSAEHMTIFFQEKDFLFKDDFSTNGTKVNGVLMKEGKLKEGDEIKLGNTVLKFKTVF